MKCPNCGAEVGVDERFCGECGKAIAEEAPEKKKPSNRNRIVIYAIIALIGILLLVYLIIPLVTKNPRLSVSPESILGRPDIVLEEGKYDLFKFSISNDGGGILTWSISDNDQPWIIVHPESGNDYQEIAINISTAGLTAGRYYGNIIVASNGGNKSVGINLTVLSPGITPPPPKSRTLQVGETWDIDWGYSLTIKSIDANANPKQVLLTLSRNGNEKNDKLLTDGEIYNWNNIFRTTISEIFSKDMSSWVTLTNTTISYDP